MEELESFVKKNRLLSAIPKTELQHLLPAMERIGLYPRQVLHQPGVPIEFVYFPLDAVLSMIASTREGETVEVAALGNEGVTGVIAILSGPKMKEQQGALVKVSTLIPGSVVRMKADVFEAAIERNIEVNRCVLRYLNVLFTQLVLSASCNRLHSLEQRCARWLLACMDRSQYEEVAVTQELLAEMLGVRRQSVDHVLDELESKRMIECLRGSIKINEPLRLASVTCECYHLAKERLDNFLA
ncbi:MAG TPA: Crp/Fnr family transcriptional regulator [Nitrospira sp.]|nr:Crp/Fnr family transcriptional regulator [Nitrospira sp.]